MNHLTFAQFEVIEMSKWDSPYRVGLSLRENWHKVDFVIRAEMFQGQKRRDVDRLLHWPASARDSETPPAV